MTSQLCVVFVCQAGELELKSLLLAASIRKSAKLTHLDLVAAVPDPAIWGDLCPETDELLESLSVRKVIIESPFGTEYPIGNKLAAIGVETEAPVSVFMDSDILCLGPLQNSHLLTSNLKAKPADLNTYAGGIEQWQKAYQFIHSDLPFERVLSTVSKDVMLPYFNAGFIAVKNGPEFSKAWLTIAKQIDECETIQHKRPWLDQIALPVAARSMGYDFEVLSEDFNFPAHLRRLETHKMPKMCHYHSPEVIMQEPVLCKLVSNICHSFPLIKTLLRQYETWHAILLRADLEEGQNKRRKHIFKLPFVSHKVDKKQQNYDFLITGLPRSGTSLLCNLLHKAPNTVVVNEPQEVFAALENDPECLSLNLLYRNLRTNILLGDGIKNKVNELGEVIEDTRFNDAYRHYLPDVSRADFCLGTKNPLAYLSRLRILCDALPDMPKIVMVRHPLHVISSWKSSFKHLNSVDFDIIPFANDNDGLLDAVQRKLLNEIRSESNLAVKRALYLRYLGEMIIRDKDRVHVIRYEDLLSHPQSVMDVVTTLIGTTRLSQQTLKHIRLPSDSKTKSFDSEDNKAVAMLCGDFMQEWGYQLS